MVAPPSFTFLNLNGLHSGAQDYLLVQVNEPSLVFFHASVKYWIRVEMGRELTFMSNMQCQTP